MRIPFPSHSFQLLFLAFFIIAITTDMRWYFILVLICISLINSDLEHLFMCLLAFCLLWKKKIYSTSLAIFKNCAVCFIVVEYCAILSIYKGVEHSWILVSAMGGRKQVGDRCLCPGTSPEGIPRDCYKIKYRIQVLWIFCIFKKFFFFICSVSHISTFCLL